MLFILHVQCTSGFIEYGVLRLGEEQASKSQALLFSQGQDIGPVQLHVPSPYPFRELSKTHLFQHVPQCRLTDGLVYRWVQQLRTQRSQNHVGTLGEKQHRVERWP